MEVHITFGGPRLRQALESKAGEETTAHQLAKDIGVSYSTVATLWAGISRQARLETMEKVFKYCRKNGIDMTLADMFDIEYKE